MTTTISERVPELARQYKELSTDAERSEHDKRATQYIQDNSGSNVVAGIFKRHYHFLKESENDS